MNLEIEKICQIQNELDIDFSWMLYDTGISLKYDALEAILNGIRDKINETENKGEGK